MADFENCSRFLNPCLLHLQKMGLELKCAACLDLLTQPVLLPCSHLLCSSCIPRTMELGLSCTVCNLPYQHQDLKRAQHIESIVSIYKSMHAAFVANLSQLVPRANLSDLSNISNHRQGFGNLDIGDKSRGKLIQSSRTENLRDVQLSMPSFSVNKRVHAYFDLNISKVHSPEKPIESSDTRECGENGQYVSLCSQNSTHDANNETLIHEENPSLSPFLRSTNQQPCPMGDAGERDIDQLQQTLPDSPPSFDNNKDSDDDSNDQGSEQCTEGLPVNAESNREPKHGINVEANTVLLSSTGADSSMDEPKTTEKCNVDMNGGQNSLVDKDSAREPKRQKLNHGLHDVVQSSNTLFHLSENAAHICAFCQSSMEFEATGPMLHYLNGRAVLESQPSQPNVLHAHERCIEWAPQVYFIGETVVNLEAEVARGKKIKCSSCAKSGAALGCSSKSCRRSFHVPCAAEITDCQWDHDNFVMFCPAHSSLKLKRRSSKSGKKKANHSFETQLIPLASPPSATQELSKLWTASSGVTGEWVLCGSALSTADKDLVTEFASLTGATITKDWKPSVTHVIAATDDMGACSRTLKFLMAILNGKWILRIDWVKACMDAKCPVDEEAYEITHDIHGCSDGPKNGRIRILEKASKLFSGLNFCIFGDFLPSYKGYLKDLVIEAGGAVRAKEEIGSQDSNCKIAPATNVVIYNRDPPQSCNSSNLSLVIDQRQREAAAFAAKTGSKVVDHTWLLESIAACRLQPWSTDKLD